MTATNPPIPDEQLAQLVDKFAQKCRQVMIDHRGSMPNRCMAQAAMRSEWHTQYNELCQEWGDSATAERLTALATAQRWFINALVYLIQGNNESLEQVLNNQP